LLFELRGVDESELVAGADQVGGRLKSAPASAKVLADDDVAALFGLEMTETVGSTIASPAAAQPRRSARSARTPAQKPKTGKNKLALEMLRNSRLVAEALRQSRRKRPRRRKKRPGQKHGRPI
jgi:hypothetical protein